MEAYPTKAPFDFELVTHSVVAVLAKISGESEPCTVQVAKRGTSRSKSVHFVLDLMDCLRQARRSIDAVPKDEHIVVLLLGGNM
jgi:hypothetical protein